jgi:hypothetical protein
MHNKNVRECLKTGEARQGLLYRWTEHSADLFLKKLPLGEGGFFGPGSFITLKNSHQDLSNEGSNFILSSLEVGH